MKANNIFFKIGVILLILLVIYYLESSKATSNLGFGSSQTIANKNSSKASIYQPAPELSGIEGYINTKDGFKLSDEKGKVILVDFWTYSCINCIRTLPYLTSWDEKYRNNGLVIVGVHTPEFEFEKNIENVKKAVEQHGIKYPVVLDNNYATWQSYKNHYWPHKYLIDADGYIRYDHIGEGSYEETEAVIQQLLMERNDKLKLEGLISKNVSGVQASEVGTPELYFGYQFAESRNQQVGGKSFNHNQEVEYELPATVYQNTIYLEGKWKNNAENVELVSDTGKIVLKYKAKVVNIVAGNTAEITLSVNDNELSLEEVGSDVQIKNGKATVSVNEQKLYNLVDDSASFDSNQERFEYLKNSFSNEKTITIEVKGKGFQIYTFTFG